MNDSILHRQGGIVNEELLKAVAGEEWAEYERMRQRALLDLVRVAAAEGRNGDSDE